MMRRTMIGMCLAAGAMLAASGPLRAAVVESTIQAWKDASPEALEITVLSATLIRQSPDVQHSQHPDCVSHTREFKITARIDAVRRSASGLRAGETVDFFTTVVTTGPCLIPDGNRGFMVNAPDRAEAYLRPGGPDGLLIAKVLKRLR